MVRLTQIPAILYPDTQNIQLSTRPEQIPEKGVLRNTASITRMDGDVIIRTAPTAGKQRRIPGSYAEKTVQEHMIFTPVNLKNQTINSVSVLCYNEPQF